MVSRRKLLAGAAAATLSSAVPLQTARRPNVIIFLMDDLGCHDLGCLGASDLKTPNIDRLASSGVRFTNWYSNAPVCAPARAALMTGRNPIRAGVALHRRGGGPLAGKQQSSPAPRPGGPSPSRGSRRARRGPSRSPPPPPPPRPPPPPCGGRAPRREWGCG